MSQGEKMNRTDLPISKKFAMQAIIVLAVATSVLQTANATQLSLFDSSNGWNQIASEDLEGTGNFKLDPGWGGQDFDAEYLFYKYNGTTLSIGLQTGFDVIDGHVWYDNKNYYAGDLALSFDGDASTYEYAFDFGLYTENYQGVKVGDPDGAGGADPTGYNNQGLYNNAAWDLGVYSGHTIANPFAMKYGSHITAGQTSAAYDATADSFYRIVSFDVTSISNFVGLDAHWTMSCGNDAIDGSGNAPVPEPATMLLFGTGLAGLSGYARKRKK